MKQRDISASAGSSSAPAAVESLQAEETMSAAEATPEADASEADPAEVDPAEADLSEAASSETEGTDARLSETDLSESYAPDEFVAQATPSSSEHTTRLAQGRKEYVGHEPRFENPGELPSAGTKKHKAVPAGSKRTAPDSALSSDAAADAEEDADTMPTRPPGRRTAAKGKNRLSHWGDVTEDESGEQDAISDSSLTTTQPEEAEKNADVRGLNNAGFDNAGAKWVAEPRALSNQRQLPREYQIGAAPEAKRKPSASAEPLIGAGGQVRPLPMVATTVAPALRPPMMKKSGALPPSRPKSRAECERRCGSDGFCDPSSLLGCGGEHCGSRGDRL